MTNPLNNVKSFNIPKKDRDFWKNFPYSRLQLINGSDALRENAGKIAENYFFTNARNLLDILENRKRGSLKEMKTAFYYMQTSSVLLWPRLCLYDPLSSLIYSLRVPEYTKEDEKEFFNSFPDWVQKLIIILVKTEIQFSKI